MFMFCCLTSFGYAEEVCVRCVRTCVFFGICASFVFCAFVMLLLCSSSVVSVLSWRFALLSNVHLYCNERVPFKPLVALLVVESELRVPVPC